MTVKPEKRTYTYKTVGDCAVRADVYQIPGEAPRPVILWLHGGALIFGNRASIPRYQLERYLTAGYAVVSVDYRLAPETKLEAIIDDLKDAYRGHRSFGRGIPGADGGLLCRAAAQGAGGVLRLR